MGICAVFRERSCLPDALPLVPLGRITALRKPSGGIRENVVGDVFRRLVARTIAQQISPTVERGQRHSSMLSPQEPELNVSPTSSRR